MNFGFSRLAVAIAQLAYKSSLVASLSPCFCKVSAHGARRSPDLVCERELLLRWEHLAQLKNLHCRPERQPVNPQVFVISYSHFGYFLCLLLRFLHPLLRRYALHAPTL